MHVIFAATSAYLRASADRRPAPMAGHRVEAGELIEGQTSLIGQDTTFRMHHRINGRTTTRFAQAYRARRRGELPCGFREVGCVSLQRLPFAQARSVGRRFVNVARICLKSG